MSSPTAGTRKELVKRIRWLGTILLLVLVSLVGRISADWTMELMNGQNDRREVKLSTPLHQRWMARYQTGSDPVLMDGKLYLAAFDTDWRFRTWLSIRELDTRTGKSIKEHRVALAGNLKWRRMMGYQGKLYISTVWDNGDYVDDKIVSRLWAYDPIQEKVIWKFEEATPFSGGDADNIGAWLNADNGKVFLTLMQIRDQNKTYCFDAKTGKVQWKTDIPKGKSIINTYPAIGGGKVFLGSDTGGGGGKIVAFDVNTGKLEWEKEFIEGAAKFEITNHRSLIFREGRLYVPLEKNTGYGRFTVINASDGKEIWHFEDNDKKASSPQGPTLVDDDGWYGAEFQEFLYKLDLATGKLVWRHEFPSYGYPILRFQTTDAVVYSVRPKMAQNYLVWVNKETGKEIYRHEFPASTNMPGNRHIVEVVVDDNFLVVGLEDGRLYGMEGSVPGRGKDLGN